ncbi:MAG: hypothetical protein ACOZCL_16790 [Bacillota bacterium]
MKKALVIILVITLLITLTACVPGDGKHTEDKPAGFFWGIWHGWIAPISLIIGLFNKNIRVYEVMNTGWFYDLGFYIAVVGGFGGIALSRKKHREKKKND